MNEPFNTKKIIMIGAGGLAVEIYSSLVTFYGNRIRKNFLGFISNEKKEQVIIDNKRIIGNDTYLIKKFSNINVIIAIGNISLRKKIYNKLKKKNFFFPNIYSPNLNFKLNKVKIGKGNIFCNNSIVRPRVSFGNFNIINMNAIISHDCKIGNFCNLNPTSVLSGNVKIEDNCEIGSNSSIHANIKIKKNCIIGIGSALINNTKEGKTYFGTPARML